MSKNNKRTVLRIVLGVFLIIIVAAAGFSVWVSQHYKHVIMQKLPGWVAKSTDSVYNISVDDISVNIITRNVTATGIKVWPDTNQIKALKQRGHPPTTTFNVTIPKVEVSGIQWEDIFTDQAVDVGVLTLWQPKVIISSSPRLKDSLQQKTPDSLIQNKEKKTPFIERFSADRIQMLHPDITYHFTSDNDSFYCYAKDGEIVLDSWSFDHNEKKDTSRFFYAKSGTIKLDSIRYSKPGSLYSINSSNVNFITQGDSLSLKNLKIAPVVNRELFYQRVGHQKEIYNLSFPSIQLVNFSWKRLLLDKVLFASAVNITNPSLDIFFSRLYAPSKQSKVGKFPHQLLRKMPLKMDIQTLNLSNGHFKYTEVNDKTKRSGSLLFDNITGAITNITNIDSLIALNKHCIIKMQGKFMRTSDMAATFNLLLSDTLGYFTVDGYIKDLNANQITEQAKALALAEVTSMHVSRMDMHVEGNQNYGKGNFTMLYDDLNVTLQKLDSAQHMKKRGFLSFLANTAILYPANPMPGKDIRRVSTSMERDPYKSFFSLIWKNIYQGAQETALRNPNIVNLLKGNNSKNNTGKKKGLLGKIFNKKNK
jgi:hypothetical protein